MNKNLKITIITILLILIGASCFILTKQNRKKGREEEPIRFGYLIGTETVPILVAKNQGFFEREGLDIELVNLARQRGVEFSLVDSGLLDGCAANKIATVKAIGRGISVKVVGNILAKGDPPLFTLVVQKDSGIDSLKYFEGKDFGLFAGGAMEYFFDRITEKYDIDKEKINVIPLPYTESISAFRSGRIKAIITDPVMLEELKRDYELKTLAVSSEVFPNSQNDGVVFSDEFLNKNSEAARKLMNALFKANDFINKQVEEDPEIIREILKQEDDTNVWDKIVFPKYATNNEGLKEGVEEVIRWLKGKGYLEEQIEADAIIYDLD